MTAENNVDMLFSHHYCFISILVLFTEFHCYFFHLLSNTNKLCLFSLYLDYNGLGPRDSFFLSARFTSFHTHASLLTFFFCYFVLFHSAFLNRECLGKHSYMSSSFPIAKLNTSIFRQCSNTRTKVNSVRDGGTSQSTSNPV